MKRRALLSVSDKTGIYEFAKSLYELDYELVSTGGTEKYLKEMGLSVTNISEVTNFPECLDGRVKTLHPNVHAGILAIRDNAEHMAQINNLGIGLIDIVAINLYPFKQTILKENVELHDAIENIDIGGPTMLRAAAKNWQDVAVVIDPNDYTNVIDALKNDALTSEMKFSLSAKVFEHTAAYDALIANYMRKQSGEGMLPDKLTLTYEKVQDMRYGENPHQAAAFYKEVSRENGNLTTAKQLHGKELSFNNINDASSAVDIIKEIGDAVPVAVAVKHTNPCGVGKGDDLYTAYMNAYQSDPVSIFGGIVAVNRTIDAKTAEEMGKLFLEIIIAPDFDDDALELLKSKKNIRLLQIENITKTPNEASTDMKKVVGGLLYQQINTKLYDECDLKVVTKRSPTEDEMQNLIFGMQIVKNVKSNAIVLTKDNRTVGVGPGQTNRVTALDLAINYAKENAKGAVMASDAFIPFADCVELAAKHGITAIIQPGGSVRDEDSINACDEANIAMVFTGTRHFKH